MNQSSIYKKIGKVMKQIERIPKNGFNEYHKYRYVTESDLMDAIRPLLAEAGLAFYSSVLEQQRDKEFTKVKMEFVLADADTGECIKSIYWGEAQDKGDKGLYKAYTGATKYFLMKTFLIATGDDPERDEEENGGKSTQKHTQKKTQQKQTRSEKRDKKDGGKMNEQQDNAITKLVSEITDGDPDKLEKLDEWIGEQISGFPGLGKEMSYNMAANVIRLLVRYKQRKAAGQ